MNKPNKPAIPKMVDTEWIEAIAKLLGDQTDIVERIIHPSADSAPESLCENEIIIDEKGSNAAFRVLVEPFPASQLDPLEAKPVDPKRLEDDELLPEIVNIWNHGAKGSEKTGEGFFGWLVDHGHLDEIQKIIDEYCRRNKMPSHNWVKLADYRPNGHAYFQDSQGRIAIADCSGNLPHQCEDGILYLDVCHRLAATRFAVPLLDPNGDAKCAMASTHVEVEFLRELWEKASRGEV